MENEQVIEQNELEITDEPNMLYNVIGFLCPVIGWTIFMNIYVQNPLRAKSLGTSVLAGAWLAAIFSFVVFLASL